MPQHDLVLDNASGAAFRADLNNALAALGSSMKGPNAPSAPTAGMVWVDDDTPSATVWTVKQYDGAEWIELGRLDITANIYIPSEGVIAWADVASAATVDLGAQASRSLRITGTTTITSFGAAASGVTRKLRFAGALTLTHNATSLILPGNANITTAAGDTATAISLGSGNWVVTDYMRALAFGGYQQIQRQTVSGVSAVDFTLPPGFRQFRLEIQNGRVATSGQQLGLRCGVGATFDAGASDYSGAYLTHTGASLISDSSISSGFISLTAGLSANDTRSLIEVAIDPGAASFRFMARISSGVIENSVPSIRYYSSFYVRSVDGAKDAIRILASGGANISGTFTLLGIAA